MRGQARVLFALLVSCNKNELKAVDSALVEIKYNYNLEISIVSLHSDFIIKCFLLIKGTRPSLQEEYNFRYSLEDLHFLLLRRSILLNIRGLCLTIVELECRGPFSRCPSS